MTQRTIRKLWFYSLTALLLTAATCPPSRAPVTITYEQIGACNGYTRGTGPPANAGAGGAFVVFRIRTLDNSKSATAFNFDPDRLFNNGSSAREHVSTNLTLARDIFPSATVAVTVPPGTIQ